MKKVVAALISNENDETLLCRKKSLPYYILPGGKPEEEDESDEATLKREIKEELQCECEILGLLDKYYDFVAPNGDALEVVLYAAKLMGEPKASNELVELKWYKPGVELTYPMTQTTQQVLLRTYGMLYISNL